MEKSLLYIIPPPPAIPPLKIKVSGEEMIRDVLEKCEELGWLWASGSLPTKLLYSNISMLYLSKYIVYTASLQPELLGDYLFFDFTKSLFSPDKKDGDLKFYNTKAGRTTCYSCNGPLKNPMGTPQFQYCPTCEP